MPSRSFVVVLALLASAVSATAAQQRTPVYTPGALNPNQQLRIPPDKGFLLDKEEGTEKLWMIWSSKELPEFEALKQWTESGDGSIHDNGQLKIIQNFLATHPAATAQVDPDAKLTRLNQKADPLVYLLRLEHH